MQMRYDKAFSHFFHTSVDKFLRGFANAQAKARHAFQVRGKRVWKRV